jgi:outer membrane protein OmpA-like peptidoglycan-associated protein
VADATDGCPTNPEDRDGFEDDDGCPDTDNDQDGFADKIDKCPDEAEVVNQYEDDDGCPDEKLVTVTSTKFELKQTVHFEYNTAEIKSDSFNLLEQVGKALNDNPQIKKVRIEGHTDDVGGDDYNMKLSRKRAEAVKKHLVDVNGVAAERLVVEGFGKTRPVQQGDDEESRALNRRVEFVIVDTAPQ